MAETPEGKVKRKCKAVLKERGAWHYMPVQNGMGVVGIPDLICCWYGVFLAIETKAPGKKSGTTANQDKRMAEIEAAHGVTLVIDDPEELRYILDSLSATKRFHEIRRLTQWLQKARTLLLSATTKKSTLGTRKNASPTGRSSTGSTGKSKPPA